MTDTTMYRRWPSPGVQGRGLPPTLQPLFPGGQTWVYSQTAGSGLRRAEQEDAEPLRVHSQYGVYPGEDSLLPLQDQDGQEERILASGPDAQRTGTTGLHHPSGEGVQVEGHAVWRG